MDIPTKMHMEGYLNKADKNDKKGDVFLKKMKVLGQYKLKALRDIHKEFNEYLIKNFGKDFNEYKKFLIKLKKDNLFECISIVEDVPIGSLWSMFKDIVLKVKKSWQRKKLPEFLYFYDEDNCDELFIENLKKRGFHILWSSYIPFNFLSEERVAESMYVEYGKLVLIFSPRDRANEVQRGEGISKGQKIFEQVIERAVRKNVSDIHIVPGAYSYCVYFREDGFFILQKDIPLSLDEAENLFVYLMRRAAEEVGGQFNPDTRLVYQDARISVPEGKTLFGKDFDLRLAFIPDGTPKSRLEVCIRVLYKGNEMVSSMIKKHADPMQRLKMLGYLEEDVKVLKNILYKRNGIVIVSGITNSGKSTLVSNLLASINDKKIGTIEDPIEYYIESSNYVQHQLFISDQEKLKMDFVDYVKAFKRADYDIVFVGEWRNHKGLTEAILEQAYAGQLIFTTLHVGSSFQVLKGLESVFKVNIEELKPILLLCWNQVLVPKLCPYCRKKVEVVRVSEEVLEICKSFPGVTEEMMEQLEKFILKDGYVKGEGCEKCHNGYKGRQVIYDYFLPTVDFWERLNGDYSHYNVVKSARIKKTKIDTFLQMVRLGLVDINDVYKVL